MKIDKRKIKEPFDVRFWRQVDRDPEQFTCWIWTGATTADGYGSINRMNTGVRANRVAWELARGPLLHGDCVLHRCDKPLCVNPEHLFLGDRAENLRDADRKKRANRAGLKMRWRQ